MKILRAFPETIPPGRNYVVDQLERFYHSNYDYSGLGQMEDDILLLEWDIVVSPEELQAFKWYAEAWQDDTEPHVVVAPYKLYGAQKWPQPPDRPFPVWAHRHVYGLKEEWIQPHDSECDLFGFGMIYLPIMRVKQFLAADPATRGTPPGVEAERYEDRRFIDGTFSAWHWRSGYGPAYVTWDVLPRHIHY